MKNFLKRHFATTDSFQKVVSYLVFFIICFLVMSPLGTFNRDIDVWELTSENLLKSPSGTNLNVNLKNVRSKKLEVITLDGNGLNIQKKIYRITLDRNQSILNGSVLTLLNEKGETVVSSDGQKFYRQKNKLNELNFSEDFKVPEIGALKIERNINSFDPIKISNTRAMTYSANVREIEFYAVFPEDFSKDKTEDELVEELLRVTFNANQYLADLNFTLVPVGIKIYRNSSKYTGSIAARDPYQMLAAGVVEKAELGSAPDLLVIFSRSFFLITALITFSYHR